MIAVVSPRCHPRDRPIGFAHRGARAECRDNTMESFRRALQLGALGIESDAWVTADGVVVLDHDGLVRRGVRRVPIRALPRHQLPAHIPSLEDLLTLTEGVDISLDIRDPATAAPTIDLVETGGRAEQTWLCGRQSELMAWRRLSARVRLVNSTRLQEMPEGLPSRLGELAADGVDALNLRGPEWNPARVDLVHDAGLLAFAWDAQRARTLSDLVAMGVDAVYSDHVTRMVDALAPGRQRR
jgi:glycerophosphoryl diester phosphodiesterase